jgi:hypothetical protein
MAQATKTEAPVNELVCIDQQRIDVPAVVDLHLVFLERASARLLLVKIGTMNLGEAFDGLVRTLNCSCARDLVEQWERDYPPLNRRRSA